MQRMGVKSTVFIAVKGTWENLNNYLSRHNVKKKGKPASADHVAEAKLQRAFQKYNLGGLCVTASL